MAIIMIDECINFGACLAECSNTAIDERCSEWSFAEGKVLSGQIGDIDALTNYEPISYDFYYIVPDIFIEYKGFHEEPLCAPVCPIDCFVPDKDNVETEKDLITKKAFLHFE